MPSSSALRGFRARVCAARERSATRSRRPAPRLPATPPDRCPRAVRDRSRRRCEDRVALPRLPLSSLRDVALHQRHRQRRAAGRGPGRRAQRRPPSATAAPLTAERRAASAPRVRRERDGRAPRRVKATARLDAEHARHRRPARQRVSSWRSPGRARGSRSGTSARTTRPAPRPRQSRAAMPPGRSRSQRAQTQWQRGKQRQARGRTAASGRRPAAPGPRRRLWMLTYTQDAPVPNMPTPKHQARSAAAAGAVPAQQREQRERAQHRQRPDVEGRERERAAARPASSAAAWPAMPGPAQSAERRSSARGAGIQVQPQQVDLAAVGVSTLKWKPSISAISLRARQVAEGLHHDAADGVEFLVAQRRRRSTR